MKRYLTDEIGEEYKEWTDGHMIFLSAYTGAGKSTFVLESLVEYAARKGKRILYLVNRSILKKQIENMINTKIKSQLRGISPKIPKENIDRVVKVELYQNIEKKCLHESTYMDKERKEYQYIVADECHYFLEDSIFNTYNQLSYEWILKGREDTVLVFISATIDKMKKFLIKDLDISDAQIDFHKKDRESGVAVMQGERYRDDVIRNYPMDADYSFVNLELLKNINEVVNLVRDDKSAKWLIFVDSIKKGEEIQSELLKEEVDSVFIDAELKSRKELAELLGKITTEEQYDEQVLIATSVLDNGVSITDCEVRKVIIMASTREEFIQMLGRKRIGCDEDGKLDVYILQRSKEEFKRKLSHVNQRQKYINNFPKENGKVLEGILKSELNYQCARNVCFVRQGKVEVSKLAIEQYDCLFRYYQEILDKFDQEGGTAFLKEQLEWIGAEKIDEKIKELMQTIPEKVSKVIENYVGRDLSKEDNMELRECIRDDIKKYLEGYSDNQNMKQHIDHFKKPSKAKTGKDSSNNILSDKRFNECMEYLGLNYRMKKEKKIWKIEKIQM